MPQPESIGSVRFADEPTVADSPARSSEGSAPSTIPPESQAEVVRAAAAAVGCGSESCLLASARFRDFAAGRPELGVSAPLLDRELALRYKPPGPRDSRALTSNHNLDGVLRQWARRFPQLFPCPFAMMDFDRTGEEFAALDLVDVLEGRAAARLADDGPAVRRPAPCFACVLNTDVSTGRGKHWVAVFVDMRAPPGGGPWTVEYFNSAGNPPPRAVVAWMERTRARLAAYRAGRPGAAPGDTVESVAVTEVDHQLSQTECGLYALYYIRSRLEGRPPAAFAQEPIPDAAMTEFRTHVFRAA